MPSKYLSFNQSLRFLYIDTLLELNDNDMQVSHVCTLFRAPEQAVVDDVELFCTMFPERLIFNAENRTFRR